MADKLKFSDEHLWVRIEGNQVHVGLSDFLQAKLGEIIAVQLPDVGEEIERGEPFGELESVREVHELIGPISGVVVAINTDIEDHPTMINEDPYHEGWLIELELRDETELEELIEPDEYDELIAGEEEDEE
jgi:glycine cleavage system H protein